ncbi:group II intron reverse transcriptase/maturase [Thiorhodococcus minor]|uniref:Group II intron reverse transcriptase/maturase n=1 Tax=Thiorhodococcus minor TaxID=57489 RepID=A0A6M0K5F9_9GAMM|nr:group II intron reverse transcriptase/maturase [Thiorhodococcus minor]NEV64484.1 group II intron reverse transcriptase/maturase [Thiorhodococcus minor]
MTKTPIDLQDLRKRIYIKAKAEPAWRFWGLCVHVCKEETLRAAYAMAKANNGAPGSDGVTFAAIEADGVEAFLQGIRDELVAGDYRPQPNRRQEIPKGDGRMRVLGIPCIRDRVVQGALKLILEPIFEADFQDGNYGYRPKRTAHQAVQRVAEAIVSDKTHVIDVDLASYFDTVRHDLLLGKVAQRVSDEQVLGLLKRILKASGKRGVPQGGVISPLLSNLYLNEVDRMLERAKEVTHNGRYTYIEYARFADDLVILVDEYSRWDWLKEAAWQRLVEELAKLDVRLNDDKTRRLDLSPEATFSFLGFDFRRVKTRRGVWGVHYTPRMKARTALLQRLKDVFRRHRSQPIDRVIALINPILRGWVGYFRVGHASRCFGYVKDWVEKKIRRHLMRARQRQGFGWKRWSRQWLYQALGLFNGYRVAPRGPNARPAP